MVKYLTNAFSLNMLSFPATVVLDIDEISSKEFCDELASNTIVNAIGHKGTVDIINNLCRTNYNTNRIQIQLINNDVLLIPQVTFRIDEGKVLSREELEDMLRKGLIKFLKVRVNYI
ncbi:MAG: DUF1874 domain-containing protein [Candidatus Methanomethylicia archaeon]